MTRRLFASVFILLSLFAFPAVTPACPLCKDAISTPSGDDEVNNMPRAYNNSIYLMIGVPYLALGIVGFAIYRGVQQNAAFRDNVEGQ